MWCVLLLPCLLSSCLKNWFCPVCQAEMFDWFWTFLVTVSWSCWWMYVSTSKIGTDHTGLLVGRYIVEKHFLGSVKCRLLHIWICSYSGSHDVQCLTFCGKSVCVCTDKLISKNQYNSNTKEQSFARQTDKIYHQSVLDYQTIITW